MAAIGLSIACDDDPGSSTSDTEVEADAASDTSVDLGPLPDIPEAIPTAEEWLCHLNDEILPDWLVSDALGDPEGNFPTFRCDDGTAYHEIINDCPELSEAPDWISDELGRQYIRMMSRQTYLYGAAFHLTGDERLFELHQAGAAFLREVAFDSSGGSVTYIERSGATGPDSADRTSQDLAYALIGLAMNYYLRRDPAMLAEIEDQRQYIFDEYWDDDIDMLRWTRENVDNQQELATQLDQLNAYLVLLYRFEDAYLTESGPYEGAWGAMLTGLDPPDPEVAPGTEWWSYVELNDMAATLPLEDPSLLSYLETTYPVYLDRMIDPLYGGVYALVENEDDVMLAKAHLWKSGFYELEHVVVLYVFEGSVSDSVDQPFEDQEAFTRTRVTFTNLH